MAFWTQILRFLRRNCNGSHKSIAKVWVLMIMTRFLCICGHWRSPSLRRLFHIIICLIFNYCLNFRSIMSHTWWICLVWEDFLPLSSRCGIKVARKLFLTDSKKLILNIFFSNFFVFRRIVLNIKCNYACIVCMIRVSWNYMSRSTVGQTDYNLTHNV